jgi:hypothetical protein
MTAIPTYNGFVLNLFSTIRAFFHVSFLLTLPYYRGLFLCVDYFVVFKYDPGTLERHGVAPILANNSIISLLTTVIRAFFQVIFLLQSHIHYRAFLAHG